MKKFINAVKLTTAVIFPLAFVFTINEDGWGKRISDKPSRRNREIRDSARKLEFERHARATGKLAYCFKNAARTDNPYNPIITPEHYKAWHEGWDIENNKK
jgi:hypothetical protein